MTMLRIMSRQYAGAFDEKFPGHPFIVEGEGGEMGVHLGATVTCLQNLGFKVDWAPSGGKTLEQLAPILANTPRDAWVLIPLKAVDGDAHILAWRAGKVYDNYADGLLPEAHPLADVPALIVGFVTRSDDDEEPMKEAA
jgi:hypothetical protein